MNLANGAISFYEFLIRKLKTTLFFSCEKIFLNNKTSRLLMLIQENFTQSALSINDTIYTKIKKKKTFCKIFSKVHMRDEKKTVK